MRNRIRVIRLRRVFKQGMIGIKPADNLSDFSAGLPGQHGRGRHIFGCGGTLRRVVAKSENHAVAVPMQIRIQHGAQRQLALQNLNLARRVLPVLDHHEPRTGTRTAPRILVDHMRRARVWDTALRREQPVKVQSRMRKDDSTSQRTDFFLQRGTRSSFLGQRQPLRHRTQL